MVSKDLDASDRPCKDSFPQSWHRLYRCVRSAVGVQTSVDVADARGIMV
jgi:hypothetical protein